MKAKRELTQIIFLFIVFLGLVAFQLTKESNAAPLPASPALEELMQGS